MRQHKSLPSLTKLWSCSPRWSHISAVRKGALPVLVLCLIHFSEVKYSSIAKWNKFLASVNKDVWREKYFDLSTQVTYKLFRKLNLLKCDSQFTWNQELYNLKEVHVRTSLLSKCYKPNTEEVWNDSPSAGVMLAWLDGTSVFPSREHFENVTDSHNTQNCWPYSTCGIY